MSVASIRSTESPVQATEPSPSRGPTSFADVLADARPAGDKEPAVADPKAARRRATRDGPDVEPGAREGAPGAPTGASDAGTGALAAVAADAVVDAALGDVVRGMVAFVGAAPMAAPDMGRKVGMDHASPGRSPAPAHPAAVGGASKRAWSPAIKSWLEEGRVADADASARGHAAGSAGQTLADAIEKHLVGQHRPPAQPAGRASPDAPSTARPPRNDLDGSSKPSEDRKEHGASSSVAAVPSPGTFPSPSSSSSSSPSPSASSVSPSSAAEPAAAASAPLQHLQAQLLDPASGVFLDGRRAVISLDGITMVVSTSTDGRTDVDMRTAVASTAASLGAEREVLARGLKQEGLSLDHLAVVARSTGGEPVPAVGASASSSQTSFGDPSHGSSRERPEAPVVDEPRRGPRPAVPASGDGPRGPGQGPGHITVQA